MKNTNAHSLCTANQIAVWMCQLVQKSHQVFGGIGCPNVQAMSVTGYQTPLLSLCHQPIPATPTCMFRNPPNWSYQPVRGNLQPEFRLPLAQHSLYVYLPITQPVFYSLEKDPCHLWHKNSLQAEKRDANVCVQEKACEKPVNAKILIHLCNYIEANEKAAGILQVSPLNRFCPC